MESDVSPFLRRIVRVGPMRHVVHSYREYRPKSHGKRGFEYCEARRGRSKLPFLARNAAAPAHVHQSVGYGVALRVHDEAILAMA